MEDGLEVVLDHPARDEVVVVAVEGAAAEEVLVCEGVVEVRVLQDGGADELGAAGDDEDGAVEVRGGGAVEVVAFEVEGCDEVEEVFEFGGWVGEAADALGDADLTDGGVFEGGQGRLEEGGLPENVIICCGNNAALAFLYCGHDLLAFVGILNGTNTNAVLRVVNDANNLVREAGLTFDSTDDDLQGVVGKDRSDAFNELFVHVSDRWKYYRTISRGVGRIHWERSGGIDEEGDQMNDESEELEDKQANES